MVHRWQLHPAQRNTQSKIHYCFRRQVVEAQALPAQTTNQPVKLIALIHAFQLTKGQSLSIYTNSRYAFHILSHMQLFRKSAGY